MKINFQTIRLERLSLYHQRASCHPQPIRIGPGYAYVELVTAGRGWVQDGGDWREVTAGHLLWNGSGDETIARSDFADPYRCLAVRLRVTREKKLAIPRFSVCSDVQAVRAFCEEVVRLFLDESIDRALLCQYVLGRLLLWVHRHTLGERPGGLPQSLRHALACIESHYAGPCGVTQMARAAGWSPAYLHQMFRQHLATTPHQALRARRLRAAREQLASTSHPVKRIAVECGFANASALIHAFRAGVGETPKSYRLRHAGMVEGVPVPRSS